MVNDNNTSKNQLEGKETVEFFKDLDKEALQTERFVENKPNVLLKEMQKHFL